MVDHYRKIILYECAYCGELRYFEETARHLRVGHGMTLKEEKK